MSLNFSHTYESNSSLNEKETSDWDTYKILKDENIKTGKTLVVAHWYFRNWDFYKNISKKILEEWVYDEIVLFDFSWHDWWKTEMSFNKSLNRMERIIKDLDNKSISIWWHSYWSLISSFITKMSEHQNYDSKKIDNLILTSLPYSINEQLVTQKLMPRLYNKENKNLKWFPKKAINEEWYLNIWELTVKDIWKYSKNFMNFPTLEHLWEIYTPTKIVRARVDVVLGIWTLIDKDWKPRFIWTKEIVKNYEELQKYFLNVKNYSINFWWHWLKVPETNKDSKLWKSHYQKLIDIIVNKI